MKENISIIDAVKRVFSKHPDLADLSTWEHWLVILKAIFGLPLDPDEVDFFKQISGRDEKPEGPFRSVWILAGRRSGKSFISALCLVYLGIFRKWQKARHGTLICLAVDKSQAKTIFDYCLDFLDLPLLKPFVKKILSESIILTNGIRLEIHSCDYRHIRGRRVLAAVLDEVQFYTKEISTPEEIIVALRPALFENPDSLMIAISTVRARFGICWDVFSEGYGQPEKERLVIKADTLALNPTYPKNVIQKELARDPSNAGAEYLSEFRTDLESFLPNEVIEKIINTDVYEIPPQKETKYFGFVDVSGGYNDSFTAAVGFKRDDRIMIAGIREVIPPFKPKEVTKQMADFFKSYGITKIEGDAYSGEWCKSEFRDQGVQYDRCKKTKSEFFLDFVPIAMGDRVRILDHEKSIKQLRQLERKIGTAKDTVNHPRGMHDDLVNVICAVAVLLDTKQARPYFGFSESPMYGPDAPGEGYSRGVSFPTTRHNPNIRQPIGKK